MSAWRCNPGETIADGLKPVSVGERNFAIIRARCREVVTVSDEELGRALALLLMHGKVLVEPSGAAALAAALFGRVRGERGGIILSGGNVEPSRVIVLLAVSG